jgi:CHAT domain-containing protein
MMNYRLKISANDDSSKISLKGLGLNYSGVTEISSEKTRSLATLYYGQQWTKKDISLFGEIEEKLIPIDATAHYNTLLPIYRKTLGQYIFQHILPKNVANAIQSLPTGSILKLEVDQNVSHVPWELMYTGHNYLCLEHILGRVSSTQKNSPEPVNGSISMLLVSNPTLDLYGSQNEANYIINQLRGSRMRITRYGFEIKKDDYLKLLESGNFQVVHYSGHSGSSPEPGKCCHEFKDKLCYGYEIEALNMKIPPFLVFSNSCQSAEDSIEEEETGNTSLAGSYLKAGVGGCVGTIWTVSDKASGMFASDFYRHLLFGSTIGEALYNARRTSFKRWGYSDFIWGSYILFGDPEIRLVKRN